MNYHLMIYVNIICFRASIFTLRVSCLKLVHSSYKEIRKPFQTLNSLHYYVTN
jgi:hypothetical protein